MTDTTYYFDSKSTTVWTNSSYMINNSLTNYATTSLDSDTEVLDGNTCPGTDLGSISKVEIRAYAYGDDNDRIDLTPVFTGGDGDEHQTTPGVSPGSWGAYQDITRDTNAPGIREKNLEKEYTDHSYSNEWDGQTFTPGIAHSIDFVDLILQKVNSPGDLTVSIKATDGSGHPTGDDLTSGTIKEADMSSVNYEWTRCFMTSYALSQGTKYAIVLRALNGDSDNKVGFRYKGSDVYANGNFEYSSDSGSNWAAFSVYDIAFAEGVCLGFGDVQLVDCKVEKNTVAKSNTMYCAKVEIRVTYTPPVGGVTRSYGFIFG